MCTTSLATGFWNPRLVWVYENRVRLGFARVQTRHTAEDRRGGAAAQEGSRRPFRRRCPAARAYRRPPWRGGRRRYWRLLPAVRPTLEGRRLKHLRPRGVGTGSARRLHGGERGLHPDPCRAEDR